ncbi:MAG: L-aspartate oxidase [Leptolyngbyaceae cyanobacterium bins.302]|nr:L-aspartate oxidase [Leptolyngbyaceae cyanobacterium bins.302]
MAELPPQALPQYFDVLVIGAGAAGLYTTLCLPHHLSIGLVTKEPLSLSASDWAQGGIAAVVDPQDSTDSHIEDTLKAGVGLCDYGAVKFLVEQAPACIRSLLEMGVAFDRHGNDLALTLEAAHSHRRVLHAADSTGRAVVSTLATQVLARTNVQVVQAFTLDVWLDVHEQHCVGVSLVHNNQICWVRAGAVILATGGGGQVFAQTTNPALSTGDGVAIAHRAGAILRDLEFVQFHPTALTQPGAPHFLISEAVRGEGAHLVDDTGYRFAFDYHPAGELAPRDVVSRAIFNHLQKTAPDSTTATVWLDLRSIPADRIQYRFPNIIRVCQRSGIDVFTQPIPVAPAAHYWMGGIATDWLNQTSIPGLYAVGETASTGVHGANRLASNSLLECLVFGAQFTQLQVDPKETKNHTGQSISRNAPRDSSTHPPTRSSTPLLHFLRAEIPRLVWQSAGISREQVGMAGAIAQLETWRQEFATLPLSQCLQDLPPGQSLSLASEAETAALRQWAEVRNLLAVAELILKSALFRTESRGGHYRSDFPNTDAEWNVHTLVQNNFWRTSPVDEKSWSLD